MKNLHQTEKQLAEKLQNVPVPDVDQGWEQMRKLLENEMPEPVAGAWSGNRKWWWMGITAGLIMLGTWLTQQLNNDAALADKKDVPAAQVEKGSSVKPAENGSVKSGAENASAVKPVENSNSSSANNNSSVDKNVSADNNTPIDNSSSIDKNSSAKNSSSVNKIDNTGSEKNDVEKENKDVRVVPTNSISKRQDGNLRIKDNVSRINVAPGNKNDALVVNKPANSLSTDDKNASISRNTNEIESSVVNTSIVTEMLLESPADHFNEIENFQPEQIAITGKTDKAFAREIRKKSMKADNRRISKSSMRGSNRDNEHEITFAAGLALPQSFAVGAQQASSYNVNGKSSRITDYLPAPFFQYHINDKLFVQTELHFQSPQYTQRLLLSREVDTFFNRRFESNVHLEKLYYFNIPFNVYYSPARNFYIGGGLQYSSLLSGVASYENKSSEGQTVLSQNSVTRRFSDSVAAIFSPSEWRYQFDANYNLNRFSLGLRFNQAMRDFINRSDRANVPAIRDRNRSFLLYLRFNIWEERRKEAN